MEEMDTISFKIKLNVLSNRKMSILLISYTFMYFVIVVHSIFDFCVIHLYLFINLLIYFLVALGGGTGNWRRLYLSQVFVLSDCLKKLNLKHV